MTITLKPEQIKALCKQVNSDQLKRVEGFAVFLGHAHSGHSLIGALLDSHPDAAITNELNVAKLLDDHQLSAHQLMSVILATSYENDRSDAWLNTGYSYKTNTGFQGLTKYPKIIGDKKGGGNTRIIRKNPEILERLYSLFGAKLKFIQVVRDPYDNIAAFSHYWGEQININHVNRYFENLETALSIQKSGCGDFFKLNYSDFMSEPKAVFKDLLNYLSLESDDDFLDAVLKIVRKKEHKRSEKIQWDASLLSEIERKIDYFNKN